MSGEKKTSLITVQQIPVTVMSIDQRDYICLTDMAKARTDAARAADVIKNWLRARSTLEFLGTWEVMYNPDFKVVEFDHLKSEAGLHTFTLSAKEWIEKTNAIGIYVQSGRYGGTYAHKDIAFEFGSAISPVFKCRLVNDELHIRKRKKDIARRLPVERTHGEIIILPLTDGKLFYKIVKRIEPVRSIEFLVIFSMPETIPYFV